MNPKIKFILVLTTIALFSLYIINFLNNKFIKKVKKIELINKIIDEKIYYPSIDQDEKYLYYYVTESNPGIYKYSFETKEKVKLSDNLENIFSIQYSNDYTRAILYVKYNYRTDSIYQAPIEDDDSFTFWLLDLKDQTIKRIGGNTSSAVFLSNNQLIYYEYDSSANIDHFVLCSQDLTNCRQSDPQKYEEGAKFLNWNNDSILVYPRTSESINTVFNKLDLSTLKSEEFKNIPEGNFLNIVNNKIFGFDISPDNKNKLFVYDIEKNKYKKINIQVQPPIYYNDAINNIIVMSLEKNTKKTIFYKININNLKKEQLKMPNKIDVQNIILSQDDTKLWYIVNDYLYELKIK